MFSPKAEDENKFGRRPKHTPHTPILPSGLERADWKLWQNQSHEGDCMIGGLAKYKQALAALAHCVRVDEAKDIQSKAEALQLYARMSRNRELETLAAAIRLRAIRRIGEISKGLDKAPGRPGKILAQRARISKAGGKKGERKSAPRTLEERSPGRACTNHRKNAP
jgi:hypothetical protein